MSILFDNQLIRCELFISFLENGELSFSSLIQPGDIFMMCYHDHDCDNHCKVTIQDFFFVKYI